MGRPRKTNKDVDEPALVVTDSLHLDGVVELPVEVALLLCRWGDEADMSAVDGSDHTPEGMRSGKVGKPSPDLLQLCLRGVPYHSAYDVLNTLADSVDHITDGRPGHVKGL